MNSLRVGDGFTHDLENGEGNPKLDYARDELRVMLV